MSSADVVRPIHGWNVAKRGALLTVGRDRGLVVTAAATAWLGHQLAVWARDAELYAVILDDTVLALERADAAEDAAAAVAELIWRWDGFSKPTVSLIADTLGEIGMALALAGTHRAASTTFQFALTSPATNRLPPGNLMAALARSPNHAGTAALLDGHPIGCVDALELGLLTHIVAATEYAFIRAALADAEPIDPILDDRHADGATVARPNRPGALSPQISTDLHKLLADLHGLELNAAILRIHDLDQQRATAGTTARLTLPSRREIQSFRKA